MDEIFACKPILQLELADSRVKDYILKLENKLRIINKEEKTKCLELQGEIDALKLQIQKHIIHEDIQNNENKLLKLQITGLQQEMKKFKIPVTLSNVKANSTTTNPNNNNVAPNDADANNVLIKGFTELQLSNIPKISIINLGRHMKMKISENDIVKIKSMEQEYYKRHNLKPNKIILIVQFRTPEMKIEFIKNKEYLKLSSNLEHIEISDYVSDEVFNLYQYAKILKDHGYALIYWRNNNVYAKKTKSKYCNPILLKSKKDVDSLKYVKEK